MDHAKFWRKQADFWKGGKYTADYVRHCLAAADALDRVAALERELAEARRDGARWQFVRTHADGFRITVSGRRKPRYAVHTRLRSSEYDTYDNIDAAIDAAMGGE